MQQSKGIVSCPLPCCWDQSGLKSEKSSSSPYLLTEHLTTYPMGKKKKKEGKRKIRTTQKRQVQISCSLAFSLLEAEITMCLQYQLYSTITELFQLQIAFALKPVQNAMFILEKIKSLQKSGSSACLGKEGMKLQTIFSPL